MSDDGGCDRLTLCGTRPSDSEPFTPIRHDGFWFYDGSIVLCVENTLFRVHQTILANHSDVFADVFVVPQPVSNEQDMIDGCHVVHLHDAVEDFVDLLKAIYHPSHFDNLSPAADLDTLLSFVSGILRLSTKYSIRSLRQRCISLLSAKFPTSFAAYTARSILPPISLPISTSTSTSASVPLPPSTPVAPAPPAIATTPTRERYKSDWIMRAISLAHDTNVPLILPYAYYCVARMSPRRLLKHTPTDISWHLKALCLVGRERLRSAEMSLSHSFLLAPQCSPACQTPGLCGSARGPHKEWHVLEAAKSPDPLRKWDRWGKLNVCLACVETAKETHSRGREEVWERLPDLFELETWDELTRMQER